MVDLSRPHTDLAGRKFDSDGLAVIAVPSFGGRVPPPAAERIRQLHGNGCGAMLLGVYGNRAYEGTLRELEQAAGQAGFRPIAAVAAVAEHSIVREYASGRPDSTDMRELAQFGKRAAEKWQKGDTGLPELPGRLPEGADRGMSMIPRAGRDCSACGVCAGECPVQAIDPSSPRKADKKRCISCMRCVHVCRTKARHLSPVLTGAAALMLRKACLQRKNNEFFI